MFFSRIIVGVYYQFYFICFNFDYSYFVFYYMFNIYELDMWCYDDGYFCMCYIYVIVYNMLIVQYRVIEMYFVFVIYLGFLYIYYILF